MKYFNVPFNHTENYVCVTFIDEDDTQPFLNYLKTLSDDNRYNGAIVDTEEFQSFRWEQKHYFEKYVEYRYAYNYFLPHSVVDDYMRLMEE